MFKIPAVSRFRAATVHLGISAAIAFAVLAAMLLLWYPPPYFNAMGGLELMLLIAGVDVVLGPLLTLIVFDTRKKNLAIDLALIALVQIGALAYGIYAMQAGRPVFTVFTGDALAVVSAAEIDPKELAQARTEEFRHLSLTGPRLVAAEAPTSTEEKNSLVFATLAGIGIQHLPRYYTPLEGSREKLVASARTLEQLADDKDKSLAERARLDLQNQARPAGSVRYLPIETHKGTRLGVISASNGELLDIL